MFGSLGTEKPKVTTRILYLDCFSGISGDMMLAALADVGLSPDALRAELRRLGIEGFEVHFEKTIGGGAIAGTCARVSVSEAGPERHLPEILGLINGSTLSRRVKDRACHVFQRLAEAEAGVHGKRIDEVHFHEVGALDAIVDIVGMSIGLELLGIDRVYSSKLHFGRGTVTCRHGVLPVPVPAVVRLAAGFPSCFTDLEGEITTPTGAAIVTTIADGVGREIDLVPDTIGYGFGQRERQGGVPNALRVIIGQPVEDQHPASAVLLETNLDDVSGQVVGHLMERCFEAGALDVFTTAIQMKKNRPGFQISVLCGERDLDRVRAALIRESGTLGVRQRRVTRYVAARCQETRATSFGEVRVKRSTYPGMSPRVSAEYDDLARIAREKNLPLRTVQQQVESELRE